MAVTIEEVLFYLVILDSIIYNILVWSKGSWHDKVSHWLGKYFPFNKAFGIWYLILVFWLGLALYRLHLIF